jgi:Leucine-rich repeat (LRR) protein
MWRSLGICLLFAFVTFGQAQSHSSKLLPISELEKQRWYYSLEEALQNREQVYKLSLAGQKLKEFPMEILTLPNLQVLNLSHNRIDSLPPEIKYLKKLQVLNLHDNRLKAIPYEMGDLKSLKQLYLSRNRIVYFPITFCSLKQLEYLDISFNHLSLFEIDYLKNCLPQTQIRY